MEPVVELLLLHLQPPEGEGGYDLLPRSGDHRRSSDQDGDGAEGDIGAGRGEIQG